MEDFSFPTLEQDLHDSSHIHHLPFPHFTTSPLWFLPSVAPLESSSYSRCHSSLSASRKGSRREKSVQQQVTDEEKMDMLWEDFNEELIRDDSRHESDVESEATNGPLVHHRSPNLLLFIKVIRKLLFLHKMGAKRRSSSSTSSSVC